MFTFRPAKRESISLLLGFIGGTGSGKTYTALRVAKGIAGEKRFAVIDTENGRAKHYADDFAFDHADLREPFTAEAYTEAIASADKAGYPVIVVDSMSHVWAGHGGTLDQHESELERMAGNDWKKREQCNLAAWSKPKQALKKMTQDLLQIRAHVILCFRAEQKIEMVRDQQTGKWIFQPKKSLTGLDGWIPICEKNLPFELTTSILLTADNPGIPHPIKLQRQHRDCFPKDKEIGEETGQCMAKWAAGAAKPEPPKEPKAPPPSGMPEHKLADWLAVFDSCTSVEMAQKQLKLAYDNCKQYGNDRAAAESIKQAYEKCVARLGGQQ